MNSVKDKSEGLRKEIGCMNCIFQIFERRQFVAGRRSSGHSHKRLLQDAQHRQDHYYNNVVMENAVELQKEKPRISESTRASISSSSCSTSTFSSHDWSKTAKQETPPLKQINNPKNAFHITSTKGQQPSSTKSAQSLDIRDAVKNSMYRERRGFSNKYESKGERRGNVMEHIDSPRPSLQYKSRKAKATGCNECKSKEGQLTLGRFSYDGRESQDTVKWNMKHKELPRLSLDSKTSCSRPVEVRSNFLGRDQHESSSQEPKSHQRSSSLVAKLMGLETFPDAISPCSSWTSCNSQCDTPRPHVSQSNPASTPPRLRDTNSPTTCSVYDEIGKRLKELEFKKSGKDLRALKQILEAMENTRKRLENESRDSEDGCSVRSSSSPSSVVILKPTKLMNKVNLSTSTRVARSETSQLRTRGLRHHRENSSHKQRPKNSNVKRKTWKASEQSRTSSGPQHIMTESYTTTARSSKPVNPTSQQNPIRSRLSQSTTQLSDPRGVKQDSGKNRKHKEKARFCSETGYSSYQGNATRKHERAAETAVTMAEQPSPISVLDDTFYSEDSLSPVKKTSNAFQDEAPCLEEAEWNLDDKYSIQCTRSDYSFKHKSIHNAIDEKYMTKNLLTSQLLEDTTDEMKLNKKIQRNISFDMVDEILVRKMESGRIMEEMERTNPQGLLKEIHMEMDRVWAVSDANLDEFSRVLTEDIVHQSEDWAEYNGEIPALVLDIERQIFKDLINVVITGEVMNVDDWQKRHCRKLF